MEMEVIHFLRDGGKNLETLTSLSGASHKLI